MGDVPGFAFSLLSPKHFVAQTFIDYVQTFGRQTIWATDVLDLETFWEANI